METEHLLNTYVDRAFGGSEKFGTSIQKGLMELFSSNEIAPVLLSLYIDEKMRTTLKENDAEGEILIEKVTS